MLEKIKSKLNKSNKIEDVKEDKTASSYAVSKDETSGGGSGVETSYPWWKNVLDWLYK